MKETDESLLDAAKHLFETGHAKSPFMTVDNGPGVHNIVMKFSSLEDAFAVHSALVRFFTSKEKETVKYRHDWASVGITHITGSKSEIYWCHVCGALKRRTHGGGRETVWTVRRDRLSRPRGLFPKRTH